MAGLPSRLYKPSVMKELHLIYLVSIFSCDYVVGRILLLSDNVTKIKITTWYLKLNFFRRGIVVYFNIFLKITPALIMLTLKKVLLW